MAFFVCALMSIMTQFEIECRNEGNSVTQKFWTVLKILASKFELPKKLDICYQIIFYDKINYSFLTSGE